MNNYEYNEIDLYSILNLNSNCKRNDIKKSYRKLAVKFHPDKNKNNNTINDFIKVQNAYEILINEESRKEYDNYYYKKNKIGIENILKNILENIKILTNNKNFHNIIELIKNKIIDNKFNKNILSIMYNLKNIDILNINLNLEFSLKEYWNNKAQLINYKRYTKDNFIEYIYPIDFIQTYEKSGEYIKIYNNIYEGDLTIKIKIINDEYNNIKYNVINNDLYVSIKNEDIKEGHIIVNFLDDCEYKFYLKNINYNITDIGIIYNVPNLGLPYYNTNNNVIDINIDACEVKRGYLFFILLI